MFNLSVNFIQEPDFTSMKMRINTNRGCFPDGFEVTMRNPMLEGSSDTSISNFTTAILLAGIFFIYEMIG